MDVFEEYEEFVDATHLPFNARATWDAYCATRGVLNGDRLWAEYSATGFSVVYFDGTVEAVDVI